MEKYIAEMIGTMILILLGNGVVANIVLVKSKGKEGGWISITVAWGLSVSIAVYTVGWVSGGHINPAVSIGLAAIGKFDWSLVPGYILAQFTGAFLGALLVFATYWKHFQATDDPSAKLAVFATIPAIRHPFANLLTESIASAFLLFGVLSLGHTVSLAVEADYNAAVFTVSPALAGILVLSIGLSLGGPTGYAINPARDLGPRLAHFLLPIPSKGGSDWAYGLIVPLFGPILGGILGAFSWELFRSLF